MLRMPEGPSKSSVYLFYGPALANRRSPIARSCPAHRNAHSFHSLFLFLSLLFCTLSLFTALFTLFTPFVPNPDPRLDPAQPPIHHARVQVPAARVRTRPLIRLQRRAAEHEARVGRARGGHGERDVLAHELHLEPAAVPVRRHCVGAHAWHGLFVAWSEFEVSLFDAVLVF